MLWSMAWTFLFLPGKLYDQRTRKNNLLTFFDNKCLNFKVILH